MNEKLYETVIEWIKKKKKVLDLGTGDGTFLERLILQKNVRAEGVEKKEHLIDSCIKKGLVVYQGDVIDGLDQYEDRSFDYVLLLGTFQEIFSPEEVIKESFRVSSQVILAYTNFAHYSARLQLMFKGLSPVFDCNALPWYKSPTVQFFSQTDFRHFCKDQKIKQVKSAYFSSDRLGKRIYFLPNLRAQEILVLLKK